MEVLLFFIKWGILFGLFILPLARKGVSSDTPHFVLAYCPVLWFFYVLLRVVAKKQTVNFCKSIHRPVL